MKRNPTLLPAAIGAIALLTATLAANAQNAKPPTQLTYQGFLTDANGVPFGNTAPVNKNVIFRIYDALQGGVLKWSSQQVVTVDKGYFSVLLGQGSAGPEGPALFDDNLTGVFTGLGASDRYLELTADGTTIAPRLRFFPSPYAMLAKSATELADPRDGSAALTISDGNVNVTSNLTVRGGFIGNAASLTNLNANQITAGTLANDRTTATSTNKVNTLVVRDGSGNVGVATLSASRVNSSGSVSGGTLTAGGSVSSHSEGVFLEWNKDGGGGMSYLLNQRGGGAGGIVLGEVTSGNSITERMRIDASGNVGIGTTAPTAKLDVSGRVVANSFKINGTPTLVLSSIERGSLHVTTPVAGVTQSKPSGGITNNGRQNAGNNSNWWKSTQTTWGTLLYTATFVVPEGELWEVAYTCQYWWATDDAGSIVMSLNDSTLPDDAVVGAYRLPNNSSHILNQTFVLSAGTQVVRVKGIIGDGSNSDSIEFPWHQPSHLVVRKYKSY